MTVPGVTCFQLIDEDGDDLPGAWEFAWEGRDPFEVVVATVTEVSGRPWKWSGKRVDSGRLSPQKCRAMNIRVGKVLRSENRAQAAAVIARVVTEEFESKAHRAVDPVLVVRALVGPGRVEDLEGRPELIAAAMLKALRTALAAAVECDGGLRVSWQVG